MRADKTFNHIMPPLIFNKILRQIFIIKGCHDKIIKLTAVTHYINHFRLSIIEQNKNIYTYLFPRVSLTIRLSML